MSSMYIIWAKVCGDPSSLLTLDVDAMYIANRFIKEFSDFEHWMASG